VKAYARAAGKFGIMSSCHKLELVTVYAVVAFKRLRTGFVKKNFNQQYG